MYVCICNGITEKDIQKAAKSGKGMKEVLKELGVANDCGTCLEDAIRSYLEGGTSLQEVAHSNPQNYKKI